MYSFSRTFFFRNQPLKKLQKAPTRTWRVSGQTFDYVAFAVSNFTFEESHKSELADPVQAIS